MGIPYQEWLIGFLVEEDAHRFENVCKTPQSTKTNTFYSRHTDIPSFVLDYFNRGAHREGDKSHYH